MPPSHLNRLEKLLEKRQSTEAKDQFRAERGERLDRFVRGEPVEEIWQKELLPLIDSLYTRYVRVMVAGEPQAVWSLRALEDFVELIAGSIQLGQGAARRIAARRFGEENVIPKS